MTDSSDITLEELFALTNAHPRTGIGYIRVSSLREIRKMRGEITTQTQRDYISAFAEREGIKIVDWVEDLNVSGRRDKFLQRRIMPTIDRISRGEADCVIVYNVSRWGRSSIENQLSEASLWEAGGRLLSATEPNDEKTTTGQFTRQQLYAMAEYQSNLIRDSWVQAHRARLRRQLPRDGRPRFGYRYRRAGAEASYEIDPVTGPLLADAYRRFLDGDTMWAITKDLRSRGVTIPLNDGRLITHRVLITALDSGFGAGKIIVNTRGDAKYLAGGQPPVISADEWSAYVAMRRSREQRGRPPHPRLALQGLVRCGSCEMPMRLDRRPDGNHKYACNGKHRVVSSTNRGCDSPTGIRSHLVDEAVQRWLAGTLSGTEADGKVKLDRAVAARRQRANATALRKELDNLLMTRRNYIRLRAAEKITSDEELDELLAEIDGKIALQQQAVEEASRKARVNEIPAEEIVNAVLDGWTTGSLDEQAINRALGNLIRGVYVGKGKTASSPSKLDIIGLWETRQPKVFLGQVRGIDHREGKHCSRCLAWKPADDFYRRKAGRDDGALTSWCKECSRRHMRERRGATRRSHLHGVASQSSEPTQHPATARALRPSHPRKPRSRRPSSES